MSCSSTFTCQWWSVKISDIFFYMSLLITACVHVAVVFVWWAWKCAAVKHAPRSVTSIYAHMPMHTRTDYIWNMGKNIFFIFWLIHFSHYIGVFVLVLLIIINFYYSIIQVASPASFVNTVPYLDLEMSKTTAFSCALFCWNGIS